MTSMKDVYTNFFRFNFFFDLNSCICFSVLLTWWHQKKKFPQISLDLISCLIWILASFLVYSLRDDINKRNSTKFFRFNFLIDLNSCVFFNILLAWWHQRKKFPQISFDLISCLIWIIMSFLVYSLHDDIKERNFQKFLLI